MMVACAGTTNKNVNTSTKTIQLYLGAEEWKAAEEANVSVLFATSSPWQNGPPTGAVELPLTHRAQSPTD
jgi:hypothetical protein